MYWYDQTPVTHRNDKLRNALLYWHIPGLISTLCLQELILVSALVGTWGWTCIKHIKIFLVYSFGNLLLSLTTVSIFQKKKMSLI